MNQDKMRQPKRRRQTSRLSLFNRLSPAESRQAREIAYRAALAVIG